MTFSQTLKRPLALALALVFFMGTLVPVTVHADDIPESVVNLLGPVNYKFYLNGSFYATYQDPFLFLSSVNDVSVMWDAESMDFNYDHVYINIESDKQPSSVKFQCYNGFTIDAALAGFSGDVYQYRVDLNGTSITTIGVVVNYSTAYSGSFGILACYGMRQESVHVPVIDLFADADIVTADSITKKDVWCDYAKRPLSVGGLYTDTWNDTTRFVGLNLNVLVKPDYLPFKSIESITFLIETVEGEGQFNIYLQNYASLEYIPVSGVTVQKLDSGNFVYDGPYEWSTEWRTITVNLSEYDLTNTGVGLAGFQEALDMYEGESGVYFKVHDVMITPIVEEPSTLRRVMNWFGAKLDAIKSAIIGVDDGSADEFLGNVQDQQQQIEEVQSGLDELRKPDIGGVDVDLNSLNDSTAMNAAASTLGVFFNGFLPLRMMLVVLTLALASYILFGKK